MTTITRDDGPLMAFLDGLDNGYGAEAHRAKTLLTAAPAMLAVLIEIRDRDAMFDGQIVDVIALATTTND